MSIFQEAIGELHGFESGSPFDAACLYRFQSQRAAETGSLSGAILNGAGTISSADVNAILRYQALWHGQAEVKLTPIAVSARNGVFSRHDDALYYKRNFRDVRGVLPDSDLLDVTKLRQLFDERLPILASVFVPNALSWLISCLGRMEVAAINEYMCHEAGHCIGVPIGDKHQGGFFRAAGRLLWPLIFAEEYRADINAWGLAVSGLDRRVAGGVVAYTLLHRFGLAALNLTRGRPGVGFVPFLHFAGLVDAGFMKMVRYSDEMRFDFVSYDLDQLLNVAMKSVEIVDNEINSQERVDDPDVGRETMLEFSIARLGRSDLASVFAEVLGTKRPAKADESECGSAFESCSKPPTNHSC